MLVAESTSAVTAAVRGPDHVVPLYDTFGFARIPATVEHWFTGAASAGLPPTALTGLPSQPRTVILLMLDSFGWQFFSQFVDHAPFLRRFSTDGLILQLTSAFPSTTAVHVTLLHTGLAADRSGIYEWYIFEPDLQAVIGSLLFSPVFEHTSDILATYGVDPQQIYPTERWYRRLQDAGVMSTVLLPMALTHSVYTRTLCQGALVTPFHTIADAATRLYALFARQQEPAFYHLYIDTIDAAMHLHGPDSAAVTAEIAATLDQLERHLMPVLQSVPKPALLLLTADHGQVSVDPQHAIVLNRLWPDLTRYLRRGGDRQPLPPSGSPRVMVLHLQPETVAEVQAQLQLRLGEQATVVKTTELVTSGYFGPQPGERLLARLGELTILPAPGKALSWEHPRARPFTLRGLHGSLTPAEMLTELAILPL
ncbi:alkaline phosphatase family protein [Chloroflexus aggregans]|uniref:Type I phosphodiesterase/nucleotide pyrophosphatase n=1 Tax=Chloroflexus aggregans (strain MD-66 / DSM 9485) TaxID=326427 RepID=B8G525_CHLAD|nr:alkaline phosphatase family protein [Chloroflexus aggregans]ACL23658.1 type I phosphodiesterase/nucleotide pyrophosphatase [Chloroflexus aggregans DSM 9485]